MTKHGQRKILFFLGKGHLLNHDINSSRSLSLSCESVTPVLVLKIPKKSFLGFMKESFPLTQAVLDEYERYLWRLAHQLKNTSGSMVTERKIAAKLWKLGRDFGERREEGGLHQSALYHDFNGGLCRRTQGKCFQSLQKPGGQRAACLP